MFFGSTSKDSEEGSEKWVSGVDDRTYSLGRSETISSFESFRSIHEINRFVQFVRSERKVRVMGSVPFDEML